MSDLPWTPWTAGQHVQNVCGATLDTALDTPDGRAKCVRRAGRTNKNKGKEGREFKVRANKCSLIKLS